MYILKKLVIFKLLLYYCTFQLISVNCNEPAPIAANASSFIEENRTEKVAATATENVLELRTENVENREKLSENAVENKASDSDGVIGTANSEIVSSFSKDLKEQSFSEAVSNSGIASNDIGTNLPPVTTLSDITKEFQEKIAPTGEIPPLEPSQSATLATNKSETPVPISADTPNDTSTNGSVQTKSDTLNDTLKVPTNLSAGKEKPEEIPSFNEWAQKRLEEAEKEVNFSTGGNNAKNNNKTVPSIKRWKNYASLDCGAKVIASNPEAVSPGAILSPSRDEYKLNACHNRIWFVVELCEAIQAQKIDLANYELFSSSPKDFTVSISDRFPTRDWSNVGQFVAKDEKDIQSFDLDPQLFGKYIKVEIKSHYGTEHYCPISLFRVFGTSVLEVLQKEDPAHVVNPHEEEEDEESDDEEMLDDSKALDQKNLFNSVTDGVFSIVKKVLGKKESNKTETTNKTKPISPIINSCTSPSHLVVCVNCSDILFGQVYELLSCKSQQIRNLVAIPFIKLALVQSDICQRFGYDLSSKNSTVSLKSDPKSIESFFPARYLGAMCNAVAIQENKVVLNISQQYSNGTEAVSQTEADIVNIHKATPEIIPVIPSGDNLQSQSEDSKPKKENGEIKPTKTLENVEIPVQVTESSVKATDTIPLPVSDNPPISDASSEASLEKNEAENAKKDIKEENTEVPMEMETVTESIEKIEDHLDHFISEFNSESATGNSGSSSHTANAGNVAQAQKESVFLRLSNRIKALERNMSLSSQYLEELSKRYKKQVEEMQRLLEKTVLSLQEESQKKDERNRHLEERIDTLTTTVELLLSERNQWNLSSILWIILIGLIAFFLYSICTKPPALEVEEKVKVERRKSIDVVTHQQPVKKKRRPSDQALKIVRSCATNTEETGKVRKKRKKKSSEAEFKPPLSSSKIDCNDWVEGVNSSGLPPYVLEESEHSTLETLPVEGNYFPTASESRLKRLSLQSNGKLTGAGEATNADLKVLDVDNRVVNVNGNSREASQSPKKERKGFRRLLRKVF